MDSNIVFSNEYYRVFFRDKGPSEFILSSGLYQKTLSSLTNKSILRRGKVRSTDSIITFQDLPIYHVYLDSIVNMGFKVKLRLKWENYAVVESGDISKLKGLKFIKSTQKTSSKFINQIVCDFQKNKNQGIINKIKVAGSEIDTNINVDYGNSFFQISSLNVDKIHKLGISGDGINIGFIDSGFRWKKHKAFQNVHILNEYDFIYMDSITANEEVDVSNQDNHGTLVLSLVSALDKSNMIGVSPNSSFTLAKTEDLSSETGIEEDNFAAAIEWMDSLGVEIINASLGYRNFDSSNFSYDYFDLNGNSALSSKYVNYAVERGIIFFNAAGNNGNTSGSINAPSDADRVISVGSLDSNLKDVSDFSSRGPNSLNIIKPDFVTYGNKPICVDANDSSSYIAAKGTSVATPLLTGSAALLLSVFPELTPTDMKNLLIANSDNKDIPNNDKGYGLPNIYEALKSYDIAISPINYYYVDSKCRLVTYILSDKEILDVRLFIKFNSSIYFEEFELIKSGNENEYFTDIPISKFNKQVANCYILVSSLTNNRRIPYYLDSLIEINPLVDRINFGVKLNNLPLVSINEMESLLKPEIIKMNSINPIEISIFTNTNEIVELKLFDSFGNILQEKNNILCKNGLNKLGLNITNLTQGVYFVGVFSSNRQQFLKFLIIF